MTLCNFLDIKIVNNQTDVYYKPTHTGQYTHFSSYTPWRLKTAWISALYHRSKSICNNAVLFSKQLSSIKSFLSWNGYPKNVRNAILHRLSRNNKKVNNDEDNQLIKIYFRLPYAGIKGEQLVKSYIRKMRRFLKTNVKFIVLYDTNKISYYCSNKDKVPELQRHNVVYLITCPGCNEQYVGKTNCCISTRLEQHGNKPDQPMYQHFMKCDLFQDTYNMLNIGSNESWNSATNGPPTGFMVNALFNNFEIIRVNRNWSRLLFLESLMIKRKKPLINTGLKFTRELVLFS